MWQYTIKCGLNNADYIQYINNKMANTLLKIGGNIALAKTQTEWVLSMVVPKQNEAQIAKLLKIYLCDIFCEKLKYNYIKRNWIAQADKNTFFDLFVNVCTYFDIELERKIVMRNLVLNNSIMLDTYLDFNFPTLKQKWQDLVNLVNNNIDIFFQDETFFEIFGFIVANLGVKNKFINVYLSDNNQYIVLQDGKMSKVFCESDIIGVITKLVELSPKKVLVKMPKTNNFVIDKIVQLFGSKVELLPAN